MFLAKLRMAFASWCSAISENNKDSLKVLHFIGFEFLIERNEPILEIIEVQFPSSNYHIVNQLIK